MMESRHRFMLLVLAAAAAACGREHLSPALGRSNREVFTAQAARPPGQRGPPPNMALDPQEAQVVGHAYVRSLGGKQGKGEAPSIVYVDPQQPAAGATRLAPSVPKD